MKLSPLLLAAALALPAAPALADGGASASSGLSAEQRSAWREVFAALRAEDWPGATTKLASLPDGPLHRAARAELYLSKNSP